MSQVRGKINYKKRAAQLRDFSGLRFEKITPTDIDGFVEFREKLFVLMEAKVNGKALPNGQRRAIKNLCEAISGAGKIAVALILTHNTPVEKEIDFASCKVVEYWIDGKWKPTQKGKTCREAIEWLLREYGLGYLIDP